jgi:hypothetical protein
MAIAFQSVTASARARAVQLRHMHMIRLVIRSTLVVLCLFIVKPSLSFDLLRVAGYSLFPRDKVVFRFYKAVVLREWN